MIYINPFRIRKIAVMLSILFVVSYARSQQTAHDKVGLHKITVVEVIQTTSYTYLLATEKDISRWLALPKIDAKVGQEYFHAAGMEMRNFKSKELGRVFESVTFLTGVINADSSQKSRTANIAKPSEKNEELENTAMSKPNDAITLAELFSDKINYASKKVKVHGKVVKYNSGIMGKNWIHIQDGTEYSGKNDLIITTQMATSLNKIITVEGTIVLDKDFGSGYFYDIILEGGVIIE
ncbi:MAG: hypothetical protein OEW67_05765 [Cyclobacteriaceae bacterium]|nr:hypothetical protein [Cyclobacteriaceae bacterium]